MSAAIVDLQQGNGASTVASYVAVTRVRTREDLLIFRPFAHELFTQGCPKGPKLLLEKLRGNKLNWADIEKEMMPKRKCYGCKQLKVSDEYKNEEWRTKHEAWCVACVTKKEELAMPYKCAKCLQWKTREAFTGRALSFKWKRFCKDCAGRETRECCECKRLLVESAFGSTWDEEDDVRRCQPCMEQKGMHSRRSGTGNDPIQIAAKTKKGQERVQKAHVPTQKCSK